MSDAVCHSSYTWFLGQDGTYAVEAADGMLRCLPGMGLSSRRTTGVATSRYRSQASFGIGAEQFLRMSELGPSSPTEQTVNCKISLDVMDEEQMGFLARKPGLLHDRGNHLLGSSLDDTLCHAGVRVVIRVEQIIVFVCRRALAEGSRLCSLERGRCRQSLVDKRVEQCELVLVMQIERTAVDIRATADIRHRHLCEADFGQ